MTDKEPEPFVMFHPVANEAFVTFHSNGTITLGEKFRDQPEAAAKLFVEQTASLWHEMMVPDGWIGKPSGDAGPTVVVTDDFDRIGWERVGHVFRPFKYTDQ